MYASTKNVLPKGIRFAELKELRESSFGLLMLPWPFLSQCNVLCDAGTQCQAWSAHMAGCCIRRALRTHGTQAQNIFRDLWEGPWAKEPLVWSNFQIAVFWNPSRAPPKYSARASLNSGTERRSASVTCRRVVTPSQHSAPFSLQQGRKEEWKG